MHDFPGGVHVHSSNRSHLRRQSSTIRVTQRTLLADSNVLHRIGFGEDRGMDPFPAFRLSLWPEKQSSHDVDGTLCVEMAPLEMNVVTTDLICQIKRFQLSAHSSFPNGSEARSPSSLLQAARNANWTSATHTTARLCTVAFGSLSGPAKPTCIWCTFSLSSPPSGLVRGGASSTTVMTRCVGS